MIGDKRRQGLVVFIFAFVALGLAAWAAGQGVEAVGGTAEIHGHKYLDTGGDPSDPGGEGLEGWTVYLDMDESGNLSAGDPSTVTDGDGSYSFTGLDAGTYVIREVQQEGWTQAWPPPYRAVMDGDSERPTPVDTDARGIAYFK